MAGSFGDSGSVRRLGQALLAAAGDLPAVTDELSRHVSGLVPDGWSGSAADAFRSDWNDKAGRAHQLAAACDHVGRVLTELADQIDGTNQQASSAQQMTGGVAARLAGPAAEQRSAQLLSQATGGAEQARAAARAKLAGIAVPRTGPPLTARQVDAWASRLLAQPSMPGLDHWLHDAGAFALGQLDGVRDGGAGLWDGYKQLSDGLWDLIDVGSPAFARSWEGIGRLFEVWNLPAMESAWGGLEKGLVCWDEWRTDPARAMGNSIFNIASLAAGPKLLGAEAEAPAAAASDGADAAAGAARVAREPGPGPLPQAERARVHADYQEWLAQETSAEGRPGEPVWLRVPLGRSGPARSVLETGEAQQSPAERLFADSSGPASRADRLRNGVLEKVDELNDASKANGTEIFDLMSPRPAAGQAGTTVAHPLPEAPVVAVDTPDTLSAVLITSLLTGDLTRNLYVLLVKPLPATVKAAARDAAIGAMPPLVLSAGGSEGTRP